jgi:hypothetical protein
MQQILCDHDELNYMRMLMLDYIKCMLTGIKSWHDNILACTNKWIYKKMLVINKES